MSDYIELNGEKFRCAPEIADALIKTSERIAKLEDFLAAWDAWRAMLGAPQARALLAIKRAALEETETHYSGVQPDDLTAKEKDSGQ